MCDSILATLSTGKSNFATNTFLWILCRIWDRQVASLLFGSFHVCPCVIPYFCLNGERATLKNKTCNGAASLKKKKTEFPTDMHAQCKLSGEKGKFCFLRAFSKNVLKRQIIIFHLASGNKMSKKLLWFNREGKTVV